MKNISYSITSELFQDFHQDINNYKELYEYSISNPDEFWVRLWDYLEIQGGEYKSPIVERNLNFTKNILNRSDDQIALSYDNASKEITTISYRLLLDNVIQFRDFLIDYEVAPYDRVFAISSNNYETIVAMLATLSIGAIWSYSSISNDPELIKNRCIQVDPKILLITNDIYQDSYMHKSILNLSEKLSNLNKTVVLDNDNDDTRLDMIDSIAFKTIIASYPIIELKLDLFSFSHPACITFDTNEQQVIHSTGYLLLELLKDLVFQKQIQSNESLLLSTNCSDTLWYGFLVSLYLGNSIHLHNCLKDNNLNQVIIDRKVTTIGLHSNDIRKIQLPLDLENYSHLNKIITTGNILTQSAINLFYDSKPLLFINTFTRPGLLTTLFFADHIDSINNFTNYGLSLEFTMLRKGLANYEVLFKKNLPSSSIVFPWEQTIDNNLQLYQQKKDLSLDLLIKQEANGISFQGGVDTALFFNDSSLGTIPIYQHLRANKIIKNQLIGFCNIDNPTVVLLIDTKSDLDNEQLKELDHSLQQLFYKELNFDIKKIVLFSKIPNIEIELLEKRFKKLLVSKYKDSDLNLIDEKNIYQQLLSI